MIREATVPDPDDGIGHGTTSAAAQRCRRRYRVRCQPCRDVETEKQRRWRAENPQRSRDAARARDLARDELARKYQREYRALCRRALRTIREAS